jgi:iron complex outermembrane receptor protein
MGDIEFKTGEFDLMQVKANISSPIIGDTLLGSFGALYRERDGIQENTFDGGDYWDQDVSAYRGSLVWNLTDSLRVKFAGDYGKDDSAPRIPNRSGVDAATMAQIDFFTNGANAFLAPGTGLLQAPNDNSLPSDPDSVSTEQGEFLNQ